MLRLRTCLNEYWDKKEGKRKYCKCRILDTCDLCQIRKEEHGWEQRYKRSKINPNVVLDMSL